MAKKAGTIIIEALEAGRQADGSYVLTQNTGDWLIQLAKRVDKRDEQNRKPRKKVVRKKAAR